MSIEVTCPACSKTFKVVDTAAGKKCACPHCSAFAVVGRPGADISAAADAARGPRSIFPVFTGHIGPVNSLRFSAGGSIALSAGDDGTVRFWDVETGRETTRLTGHKGPVNSAALSVDGTFVLSGGADKTVCLWRVAKGTLVRTFEGHTDAVTSVAFYPLGGYVLSAGADGTVRIWEMATGKCAHVCKGHKGAVTSVTVHPEGKAALSAGVDRTLRLWRCDKGKELERLKGHAGPVHCAVFNKDGAFILSGSEDRTAIFWKVETLKPLVVLKGHTAGVRSVALSRDNATAVTGSPDWTVKVWSVDEARVLRTIEAGENAITAVALHSAGARIVSGNSRGVIRLWDAKAGKLVRAFGGTEHSTNTRCPSCGRVFAIEAGLVGREGLCPFCSAGFTANRYSPQRSQEAVKRGLAEMAANRLDRACAEFDEAVRLQADNYEASLNAIVCRNRMGTELHQQARHTEALSVLDEAAKTYSAYPSWPVELHTQVRQEAYAAAFLAAKICRYHLSSPGKAVSYLKFAQGLNNTLDVQDMLAHMDRGPAPESA